MARMVSIPQKRITGRALTVLVGAARHTPAKHLLAQVLRQQLGIEAVRQLILDATGPLPQSYAPIAARAPRGIAPDDFGIPEASGQRTTRSIHDQFRARNLSPSELVEKTIESAYALGRDEPSASPFCIIDESEARRAAEQSSRRYSAGESLSPLDGVIVPIKEEMHARGLPTRLGTRSLPNVPSKIDSQVVERLRAQGAIVSFQTAMTEHGLSPLGANMFRAMPRNPYSRAHLAGGSSTGSAVSVALGMSPVALGCDGGGSIRVPAAFCGVFGFKPTFGRIPMTGHGMRARNSVTATGPIGRSTYDLAIFTQLAAGSDPEDASSQGQPELAQGELTQALTRGVHGLRIGVDENLWNLSESAVTRSARDALAALEKDGAMLVPVTSRLMQHAPAIGYMTIAIEGFAALLKERERMDEVSVDLQLLLSVVEAFASDDYVLAQRVRGALRRETVELFNQVDVLALPSTGGPPPKVTELEEAMGFVDPIALGQASRYVYLANLCGNPAGTAPVGFDDHGLPQGLQIVGDVWDEASVLQVMAHLERIDVARVKAPPGYQGLGLD
jgi:aspartyl-tRNA(Asn)/glutamyl-tRNA(Gln) amidotransferase subunit A